MSGKGKQAMLCSEIRSQSGIPRLKVVSRPYLLKQDVRYVYSPLPHIPPHAGDEYQTIAEHYCR